MKYESDLAREAKALLLNLVNRAVPHLDYKGAVAFSPGDARIIKRKIIKVNNLLADRLSLPVWPDVVLPNDKDELRSLLPKLTQGQRNCITQCYGYVEQMIDHATIERAAEATRKAIEANKRAEEDILSVHATSRPTT